MVSFTPRPLYRQGKNPWYPLDRRLGGSQSFSGRGGEENSSQPPVAQRYTDWAIKAVSSLYWILINALYIVGKMKHLDSKQTCFIVFGQKL
jgi:hypothetical protein